MNPQSRTLQHFGVSIFIILVATSESTSLFKSAVQPTLNFFGINAAETSHGSYLSEHSILINSSDCLSKLDSLVDVTSINAESIAFIDAAGKPAPGLTTGNFIWIGNYEMCASLRNLTGNNYRSCKVTSGSISIEGVKIPTTLTWTGCLPQQCLNGSLDAVLPIVSKWLNDTTHGKVTVDPTKWESTCEDSMEYDAGAYAAITFVVIVSSLVIFGTFWHQLHSILKSIKEKSKNNDTAVSDNEIEGENTKDQLEKQQQSEKRDKQIEPQFLLNKIAFECFALQRTLKSLTSTETKPGQVLCLNGIRVLSINWVILGHSYAFMMSSVGDQSYLLELIKRRGFSLVSNAYSSVDSFFTLSGFLVSYLLLRQLTKRGHLTVTQWIAFYFHRYVRLTAPYLMMILLEGFLYRYMVSGPFSVDATTVTLHDTCKKDWWTNLLYINNVVPWNPTSATCLAQSWYLANDMQFFVIAPVFIVLLFYRPLLGNLVTLGAISCSGIAAAIITAHYNLAPSMALGNPQNYLKLYRVPWVRITPYLVGILGGWFYWCWGEQVKEKVKTLPEWKKVVVATPLWLATAAIEYEVVFGLYHDILANVVHGELASKADSVSYEMLARIGWSLALTIQILLCQCGLGGFINSLLSWKGWLVLSRLTYSVYLIHAGLIGLLVVQTRHAFFLQPDFEFAVYHLGVMVMSYLAAVVLYVTVEQPVALLETMTYRQRQ